MSEPEWKTWIGPCAHGRDPWTRCDECEEKGVEWAMGERIRELEAALATLTARAEAAEKELTAIKERKDAAGAYYRMKAELAIALRERDEAREDRKRVDEELRKAHAEAKRLRGALEHVATVLRWVMDGHFDDYDGSGICTLAADVANAHGLTIAALALAKAAESKPDGETRCTDQAHTAGCVQCAVAQAIAEERRRTFHECASIVRTTPHSCQSDTHCCALHQAHESAAQEMEKRARALVPR